MFSINIITYYNRHYTYYNQHIAEYNNRQRILTMRWYTMNTHKKIQG